MASFKDKVKELRAFKLKLKGIETTTKAFRDLQREMSKVNIELKLMEAHAYLRIVIDKAARPGHNLKKSERLKYIKYFNYIKANAKT